MVSANPPDAPPFPDLGIVGHNNDRRITIRGFLLVLEWKRTNVPLKQLKKNTVSEKN